MLPAIQNRIRISNLADALVILVVILASRHLLLAFDISFGLLELLLSLSHCLLLDDLLLLKVYLLTWCLMNALELMSLFHL